MKMSIRNKLSSVFGFFAVVVLSLFGKSPAEPTTADLQKAEFKTSTQRLGLSFTERIRRVFRFKWLRKF